MNDAIMYDNIRPTGDTFTGRDGTEIASWDACPKAIRAGIRIARVSKLGVVLTEAQVAAFVRAEGLKPEAIKPSGEDHLFVPNGGACRSEFAL